MSDLSPDTDKLLELARGASALSDARRAQIKAGLVSQIAAGGALSAAASHAAWGKMAWFSSPFVKGISALALVSLFGAGVYVGVRTTRPATSATPSHVAVAIGTSSSAAPAALPAVTAVSPSGASETPSPVELGSNAPSTGAPSPAEPGAALRAGTSPAARVAAPTVSGGVVAKVTPSASHAAASVDSAASAPSTADTLAAETTLLRDADQALRAGNAQRALTLLDEHAARFPHGLLEPERAAERMIARCKLGQVDAKTAQSYLAAHAGSSFAARLQDACGNVAR